MTPSPSATIPKKGIQIILMILFVHVLNDGPRIHDAFALFTTFPENSFKRQILRCVHASRGLLKIP